MKKKKIQIKCVLCGKEGTALLTKIRKIITSDFAYFGTKIYVDRWGDNVILDYWECPECYKKNDSI